MNNPVPEKSCGASSSAKKEILFHGIPVSQGIAIGTVKRLGTIELETPVPSEQECLPPEKLSAEV